MAAAGTLVKGAGQRSRESGATQGATQNDLFIPAALHIGRNASDDMLQSLIDDSTLEHTGKFSKRLIGESADDLR